MNLYSLEFLCSSQGAGGLLTWISLTTQTKVASCNKLISNTQLSMNIQQIYTTNDDLAWEHCTIQGRIKAHLANFDGDVWHIFDEPAHGVLLPSHIRKFCCFVCYHLHCKYPFYQYHSFLCAKQNYENITLASAALQPEPWTNGSRKEELFQRLLEEWFEDR